jgi:hypothetical protein
MKTEALCLFGAVLIFSPLYAQQPSLKRHPGEHLHYRVTLKDGDIDKVTSVNVHLQTNAPVPPDKPGGQRQFGGSCQKTNDPKIWDCDIVIAAFVIDGDYQIFQVNIGSPDFGASISEDFHVPLVPVTNPKTFNPPSKVTVTEQP